VRPAFIDHADGPRPRGEQALRPRAPVPYAFSRPPSARAGRQRPARLRPQCRSRSTALLLDPDGLPLHV